MAEHGWVVCAPGDPNERQTRAINDMAGPYRLCATEWNADTGAVRFEVQRPSGTFHYSVDLQGNFDHLRTEATP